MLHLELVLNFCLVFFPILSGVEFQLFSQVLILLCCSREMDRNYEAAKAVLEGEMRTWFNNINARRAERNLPLLNALFPNINARRAVRNLPPLNTELDGIAALYGIDRMTQEYERITNLIFNDPTTQEPMDTAPEPQVTNEPDPFEESMSFDEEEVRQLENGQRGGAVQWDQVNFHDLFKLKLVSQTENVKFNTKTYKYEVEITPINCLFTNETSMLAVPKILDAILQKCMADFEPSDRIIIELGNDGLSSPFCLALHEFTDFSIDNLMPRVELMNSSQCFNIDETFKIKITQVKMPSGGGKHPKHMHCKRDRKRMPRSVVSVHVGKNLCLPASLYLGRYRQEHDVATAPHKKKWKNLIDKKRIVKLEKHATEIVQESGLSVGRKFGMDDVEKFQKEVFNDYQIVVVSAEHRSPSTKVLGMKEICLLYDTNHF